MRRSERWYLGLLAAVGLGRLIEMGISRRHMAQMREQGVEQSPDPHFRWMALFHGGLLAASALEVRLLRRPARPVLAAPMLALFAASNALRWWVIRTLAGHWNVRVMRSTKLGVVSGGPYRWVRHPNYAAVFIEMLALPLIHSAWLSAGLGAWLHTHILRARLDVEDTMLLSDPAYRAAMGHKPRFIPRLRPISHRRPSPAATRNP